MGPYLIVLADFSDSSREALAYAAALAQRLQGQLVLLHLYQDVLLDPEIAMVSTAVAARTQRETRAALEKMAEALPVPTTVDIAVNPLPEVLAEEVAKYHPLLLVCGRTAEPDFLDRLLGSQVLPILRHLHYPVLMVPEHSPLPTAATRIGLVADGEQFKLLQPAAELQPLFKALGAEFSVLHVETEEQYDRARTALNTMRHNQLLQEVVPANLYTLHHTSPVEGILQAAIDTQAQWLVLIARERSLFGGLFHRSVTARVLQRSPVPVLMLPAI